MIPDSDLVTTGILNHYIADGYFLFSLGPE